MEVAQPRRSAGSARERPTHRRAVVRACLHRPALSPLGERRGKLGERRAGANGRNEVVRLVLHDAAQWREVERDVVLRWGIADAHPRPPAADDQRLAAIVGGPDRVDDVLLDAGPDDMARLEAVNGEVR